MRDGYDSKLKYNIIIGKFERSAGIKIPQKNDISED